jgi:hypothetical protein
MILLKLFTASFLFVIIFISCSNEPEPNPIIPVAKGTIKGFVYEANTNTPIYYAVITTNPYTKEIFTNIDGSFILNDITTGDYVVFAYQEGYDNDSTFVTVMDMDTATANLSLINFSEYLDYYPLDIGNYWEYWNGVSPTYSIEIVSDTIINNILYYVSVYKILHIGNYSEIRFERLDTYNALAYRIYPYAQTEVLIDSLPAKAGQTFKNSMLMDWDGISYCWSIENEEIFGVVRSVRRLSYLGQHLPLYKIVKGIGLYSFGYFLDEHILKYAIINGVEYGQR